MSQEDQKRNFMIGNALLAVCLLMIFFLGPLWEQLGPVTMLVWAGLAGAGMYLVMKDKRDSNLPD